jgi:hypothetical protein
MKVALIVFVSILLVLVFDNCKKKSDPISPCKGLVSTNADFVIEQQVGDRWFVSDTVISGQFSYVRFTAKYDADSYVWKIGSETITTKTFTKTWLPENTTIPVTLIIKKKPDTNCFPDDDGIDTVVRLLKIWPLTYGSNPASTPDDTSASPYLPVYGTYYGESTFEPGIKKFVTIIDTVWTDEANRPKRVGLIRGIPYKTLTTKDQRNSTLYDYVNGFGISALHINMKTNIGGVFGYPTIPRMEGYAWLDRNNWNKITIEYRFVDTVSKQWVDDYFTGTRAW